MTTLIRERYEILETLGAGGEALVVKALDRQHDRVVALKIRRAWDEQSRDDLLNEARILLAVPPHPALPLVREDFFDGDDYIVAMDWVDGTDLARLVQDRGRPGLAPSSVLAYLSDAAEALTHLHAQQPPVIHGDVKPGNLILTRGGQIKLVDFGMSSAPNALRRRSGTPGYRAPELAAGGPPSRAGDIYALAATAFALLTGSAPAGVLPTWEGIDPEQADQLEAALRMGMATDPARRPATPGELVERLRAGWAEALPTGVITFCMSDIEGSTAMWEADPAAMAEALVRHDELIAGCTAARGGRLIGAMGEGDSTVSVFHSAPDAVAAALDATRALAAEPWPAGIRIEARFGLHTGEAECRGDNYFGPTINLAARLRGEAAGGQVFLSTVTADLVARHLPPECSLVDLGAHRLAGVAALEEIHALKGPGVSTPPPGTECPYRGLLAFEAEDRAFFFGRESVVSELTSRLAARKLVALVGASGSGKSSVLRAGLIAAVRAGEVAGLHGARLLTPGARPDPHLPDEAGELLVVDQFEELFTLCEDADLRPAFIDALLSRAGPVAIGVRADMYGRLADHPELARAVAANQILLGAMSDEELERAVMEPARLAGLRLEPGLVELAVREVAGEPGALPLLSHALRATWERRDGRTLTVDGYRESGGVGAAVAQTADTLLDALTPQHRQLARNVFVRLTALGEGSDATRRRARTDELVPEGVSADAVDALLERLADARLLTLGEGTAEVAHEVLIREWPALRRWLEEDRDGLRLHRALGDAARMWEAGGRDPSDLYRGPRLVAATDWVRTHRPELNAAERSFLDAGLAEADRERRTQLHANRRLRGLLTGAVALFVIAAVAGAVAVVQRSHAQDQALTSDAERLGALAQTEPSLDRAMLLAVAGVELQNRPETRSALLAALQRSPALIRLLHASQTQVDALQFDRDGRLIALSDAAGVVRFYDPRTWQPRGALRLPNPVDPQATSFSPNGRTLLAMTGTADRSQLYAIDVISRRARLVRSWPGSVPPPPYNSSTVAYSPDGRAIAVSLITQPPDAGTPSAERLLMLDARTGRTRWQRQYPMHPHQLVPFVHFTPGGVLLTSAQQGDTILWDAKSGRMLRRFSIGGFAAVSANGREAALGVDSPNIANPFSHVAVLDLRTGRLRTLRADLPSEWIRTIDFTPDGSKIVAATTDNVHVWDVASGTITETYAAGLGRRQVTTLAPDGTTVVDGAQDGSVAVFDLSGTRRLGRYFSWNIPGQSCPNAPCAVVNPQGVMAAAQGDGTTAIVNTHTLKLMRTLPARDGPVANAVTWLPDGHTLVTGGTGGLVTFWNLETNRVSRSIRFPDPVWWTAVSPDGKLLAVQTQANDSPDNRVEVIRIATGRVVQSHEVRFGFGGVEFSRDGRELVALGCCGSTSTLVAWDTRTGAQLFRRTTGAQATAFNLTPDSRRIGVGTADGHVLLLNARTGDQTSAPLPVAAGLIDQIAFAPNGLTFAVGSTDATSSLWDLRSRTRIGDPFPPFPGSVPGVVFEPSGRLLIVPLANAFEWPTDVSTWERFACQVAGRNLTWVEWHEVLPNRPYEKICLRHG